VFDTLRRDLDTLQRVFDTLQRVFDTLQRVFDTLQRDLDTLGRVKNTNNQQPKLLLTALASLGREKEKINSNFFPTYFTSYSPQNKSLSLSSPLIKGGRGGQGGLGGWCPY
jgi:hypothetical protein